jgi:predicted dehydrogenase
MGMGGRAGCWVRDFNDQDFPPPRLSDWAKPVAYCDLEEGHHQEDVRQMLKGVPFYSDYSKMLERDDIDAVFIATPEFLHVENAVQAMEAGKHVLLEKAASLDVAGAAKLGFTAKKTGRVIFLGLVLRYATLYAKLRDMVANGELGDVIQMEGHDNVGGGFGAIMARWRYGRRELSGTMMLCKATHMLDVMCHIAGARPVRLASFGGQDYFVYEDDITMVCSTCPRASTCPAFSKSDQFCPFSKDFDWPDNGMAVIEYENGIRATYNYNLFSPGYLRSFAIYGTKGKVFGKDQWPPYLEVSAPGYKEPLFDFGQPIGRGHGGGDLRLIRHFFDCIEKGLPSPFTTEAIVDSVAVSLAMEDAWKTGKLIDLNKWRREQGGV